MIRLVIIDNYDSFTYNLVQMFKRYTIKLKVYRNDKVSVHTIKENLPDYILISPGPKNPKHAGVSIDFIKTFHSSIPILGICLGMQCINEFFGGQTIKSSTPVHGKTSYIHHDGTGLFKNVPSPFKAARYHSLAVKPNFTKIKNSLIINAWSSDGTIMSLSHSIFPLHGLQFHPESFLTEHGFTLIKNFLKLGPMQKHL